MEDKLVKENKKLKEENTYLVVNKNIAQALAIRYKKAFDICLKVMSESIITDSEVKFLESMTSSRLRKQDKSNYQKAKYLLSNIGNGVSVS